MSNYSSPGWWLRSVGGGWGGCIDVDVDDDDGGGGMSAAVKEGWTPGRTPMIFVAVRTLPNRPPGPHKGLSNVNLLITHCNLIPDRN